MRGSPLIRFILLAIALAATAAGLRRVTSARTPPASPRPSDSATLASLSAAPYRLLLSAPAESVTIQTGRNVSPASGAAALDGTLELDPANPRVGLVVHWKNPAAAGEHRFAKLTIEPPGQETFVHVFDAAGDIDDLIEIPPPSTAHE